MGTSAVALPQGFQLDPLAQGPSTPDMPGADTLVSGSQMQNPDASISASPQELNTAQPSQPSFNLPPGFQLDQSPTQLAPESSSQDQPGFARSFYESTLAPLLKTAGGLITHSGDYDPENPLLQAVIGTVNNASEKGQNAINILKTLPDSTSTADAFNRLGKGLNQGLYAVPIIGQTLQGMDSKWASGNYAGALGDVAAVAANLMAPELIRGVGPSIVGKAAELADTAINKVIGGSPSVGGQAADQLGIDLSAGRASTGIPRAAEKFLRSSPESAAPFEGMDVATNEGLKQVGSKIADSIVNTNLSLEDQGAQIQNALKASKTAAGQEVGEVHDAISQLSNSPSIDAKALEPIAQKFVNQLSIDNPDYQSNISPENQKAVNVLQQFANSQNIIPSSTSSLVDSSGNSIINPSSSVSKTLDFDTAGKLITQMNELIPDVPSSAGGALKQMSSALKEQMYQALPDDLASRLKATHQRYAQVSQGLDQGIARRVIGTRINPTPPELVADFLSKSNSIDVGNLRNLLGPERTAPVQRAILQNVLEKTTDDNGGTLTGNQLVSNWNKVNDGAKSLYSPEQLQGINDYIKAVQDINLRGPRNLSDTFAGSSSSPLAAHTATGVLLNFGKNFLAKIGGRGVARMLLDPPMAKDLVKSISTYPVDRGATPLGQRLLFAAHQNETRDRQADVSATTPQ